MIGVVIALLVVLTSLTCVGVLFGGYLLIDWLSGYNDEVHIKNVGFLFVLCLACGITAGIALDRTWDIKECPVAEKVSG